MGQCGLNLLCGDCESDLALTEEMKFLWIHSHSFAPSNVFEVNPEAEEIMSVVDELASDSMRLLHMSILFSLRKSLKFLALLENFLSTIH